MPLEKISNEDLFVNAVLGFIAQKELCSSHSKLTKKDLFNESPAHLSYPSSDPEGKLKMVQTKKEKNTLKVTFLSRPEKHIRFQEVAIISFESNEGKDKFTEKLFSYGSKEDSVPGRLLVEIADLEQLLDPLLTALGDSPVGKIVCTLQNYV